MCGRFQLSVKGKEISERFNVEVFDELYSPGFNCAPSQQLPVIINTEPEKLSFFRWGFIPSWAANPGIGFKLINTRAETIREKPAFKEAFATQRCLIPANGFFEWRKSDKIPFRIFLKNETLFAMAGIWETWKDATGKSINTFSIITTKANNIMSRVHHRMPVILSKSDEEAWLKETNPDHLQKLLKPCDDRIMEMYPVSKKVNSPINNGEEIIYPVTVEEQGTLF